jgi:AraC-like DNA-binding protein
LTSAVSEGCSADRVILLSYIPALGLNVSSTIDSSRFRHIRLGIETFRSNFSLPRHRHLRPYATVVLAGGFEESGYNGRIRASAGDVLIHSALDCHGNHMVSAGVTLIRLDWSYPDALGGLYHLNDVDQVARAAETDVSEATQLLKCALRENCKSSPRRKNDWPDLLMADLVNNLVIEIGEWSEANDLARETVSRGFTAAYGIAPSIIRAELRTRSAWLRIVTGSERLCKIAGDTGFADQAHMTRWVYRITGATPTVWRRNAFVVNSFMQ